MTTPYEPLAAEAPLWAKPEFAALAEGLVVDIAPRLVALVEESGERVDGCVFAWGLASDDHAEVVGVDRAMRGSFSSADGAHLRFSCYRKMRLVWYNPDAATRRDQAA